MDRIYDPLAGAGNATWRAAVSDQWQQVSVMFRFLLGISLVGMLMGALLGIPAALGISILLLPIAPLGIWFAHIQYRSLAKLSEEV